VILSLWLHFVTAMLISPSYAFSIVALIVSGRSAAAWRAGSAAAIGWLGLALFAFLQLQAGANELDVRWIKTDTPQALEIFAAEAWKLLKGAAVPALVACFLLLRGRVANASSTTLFSKVLIISIAVGAGLLLALNALRPIVIDRYLIAWQVIGAGAVTALAAGVMGRSLVLLALALLWTGVAIAQAAAALSQHGRWARGLERAAPILGSCSPRASTPPATGASVDIGTRRRGSVRAGLPSWATASSQSRRAFQSGSWITNLLPSSSPIRDAARSSGPSISWTWEKSSAHPKRL
jgi:hypothetical protein